MKTIILYFLLKLTLISSYSRAGAVKYAKDNVNNANHDCNTPREACTLIPILGGSIVDIVQRMEIVLILLVSVWYLEEATHL